MAKIPPMNWNTYRKRAEAGESDELRTGDVLDLLDSRDMAQKALRDILAACPQRPTKPFAKTIKTLAQDGLNGSR